MTTRRYTEGMKICKLHNEKMLKTIVEIQYGRGYSYGNTSDYPNAKTKAYGGCNIHLFTPKHALILYCKTCTEIRKQSPHAFENKLY